VSYRRTPSYETIASEFPIDLENLGARWYIYGQLDRSIPIGGSTMVGQEYAPVRADAVDLNSLGQGFQIVLSLRRGALVPTRPSGQDGKLTDTPLGAIPAVQTEFYFLPEGGWYPTPTDIVFDVMWKASTPYGVGNGDFDVVTNIVRIDWAQPRYGREDVVGYWNMIGREIPFQRKSLTAALRERWASDSVPRYERNV